MSDPESALGGSGTTLTVETKTKFIVNFYLKGSTSQSLSVKPSSSARVILAPGQYQVAAEIPEIATVPLYGEVKLNPGTDYRKLFYASQSAR